MPGAINFHELSLVLDKAETMLSTAADTIDRETAAELRSRIARARAELDFLTALGNARNAARSAPFRMQLPPSTGAAGDPAA